MYLFIKWSNYLIRNFRKNQWQVELILRAYSKIQRKALREIFLNLTGCSIVHLFRHPFLMLSCYTLWNLQYRKRIFCFSSLFFFFTWSFWLNFTYVADQAFLDTCSFFPSDWYPTRYPKDSTISLWLTYTPSFLLNLLHLYPLFRLLSLIFFLPRNMSAISQANCSPALRLKTWN